MGSGLGFWVSVRFRGLGGLRGGARGGLSRVV